MLQKFSGLLKEIVSNYPEDLSLFLEQKLQISSFKAKDLAQRLENEFDLKLNHHIKTKLDECSSSKDNLTIVEEKKFNIYSLDILSGKDFEQFLKWLFEELGYVVRLTTLTADSGVDLVIVKNNEKTAVQAKRFKRTNKVSNSVILKTRGGQEIYGCDRSMIVTTSFFTQQAKKEAKELKIELWDRNLLSAKIDHVNTEIIKAQQGPTFPSFKTSLFQSLLNLEKTNVFYVKRLKDDKFHLYRHGLKYPLITFKSDGYQIKKLVLRINNNKPESISKGTELIFSDSHHTYGPSGSVAYEQVKNYLSEFICSKIKTKEINQTKNYSSPFKQAQIEYAYKIDGDKF